VNGRKRCSRYKVPKQKSLLTHKVEIPETRALRGGVAILYTSFGYSTNACAGYDQDQCKLTVDDLRSYIAAKLLWHVPNSRIHRGGTIERVSDERVWPTTFREWSEREVIVCREWFEIRSERQGPV